MDVDPCLVAALRRQLERRPPGARRVGWKVGQGERESVGGGIVVGHLTSATLLEPGSAYDGEDAALHADCELAVEVGPAARPAAYAVALELVVNGEERRRKPVPAGTVARVGDVKRVLRAAGERLEAGDRVITGSVVQAPVAAGDHVVAEIEGLGRVGLTIA